MNTIEMKKTTLWHLLMSITISYSTTTRYTNMYDTVRLQAHAEMSGQLAMAYYLDIIPENLKTKHTHAIGATADEYKDMYNDILSLYVENGGDKDFAPKL